MKQILRRYGQPFEFSEFPWHILRNIFLQDRKKIKIKKTAKSLSAFYLYGKPGNSGQKERFISVEISRKKTFSPFLPKRTNEQSDNKTRTTWQRGRWPPRVFLFLNDFSFSPLLSRGLTTQGVQVIQYTSAF